MTVAGGSFVESSARNGGKTDPPYIWLHCHYPQKDDHRMLLGQMIYIRGQRDLYQFAG